MAGYTMSVARGIATPAHVDGGSTAPYGPRRRTEHSPNSEDTGVVSEQGTDVHLFPVGQSRTAKNARGLLLCNDSGWGWFDSQSGRVRFHGLWTRGLSCRSGFGSAPQPELDVDKKHPLRR